MNERLHPLTLGEILDRTAQLYRSRFLVYAGIAIIPAGTVLLSAGIVGGFLALAGITAASKVSPTGMNALVVMLIVVVGLVALPLWFGVAALGWAAMSHAATSAFLGEPISIRGAYKKAWSRKGSYLGLCLLLALIVGVAPMAVFAVMMMLLAGGGALAHATGAAAGAMAGAAVFLGFIGLAAYILWMLLRVCLAFPASVVEQIGPWDAIKRAAVLTKGTRGRIFVMFLLSVVLSWALAMGLMIPMMIGLALIPGAGTPQHTQVVGVVFTIVWYLVSFAVQALVKPVYGIALAVFYFDQRIRTEGFDIEWMMRQAGMAQEAAPLLAETWLPGGATSLPPDTGAANMPLDAGTPKADGLA